MYASVADNGRFATEPWAGLFTDAYQKSDTDPFAGPKGPFTGKGSLSKTPPDKLKP